MYVNMHYVSLKLITRLQQYMVLKLNNFIHFERIVMILYYLVVFLFYVFGLTKFCICWSKMSYTIFLTLCTGFTLIQY